MPDRSLIVEDVDFGSLGFVVRSCGDHRGTTRRQYAAKTVPGRYGEIALSDKPTYAGRRLRVQGVIDADSLSDAYDKMDEMKWRLSGGIRTIQYVDDEKRYYFGYFTGGQVKGLDPELEATFWSAEFEVWCPDSRAFGAASTVTCSTAGTGVPMGSAPVRPTIEVDGALSATLQLQYLDSTGGLVSSFSVANVSISSTEFVRVDCENQTITTSTGGTLISDWLSTVGNFITLDPHDGDMPNSSWPKIRIVNAGLDARVIYRPAFW